MRQGRPGSPGRRREHSCHVQSQVGNRLRNRRGVSESAPGGLRVLCSSMELPHDTQVPIPQHRDCRDCRASLAARASRPMSLRTYVLGRYRLRSSLFPSTIIICSPKTQHEPRPLHSNTRGMSNPRKKHQPDVLPPVRVPPTDSGREGESHTATKKPGCQDDGENWPCC